MGHSLQAALLNLATGTVVILVRRRSQGFQQLHPQSLMWASGIQARQRGAPRPLPPSVGFLYSGTPERCTAPPASQCGLPVFRHAREVHRAPCPPVWASSIQARQRGAPRPLPPNVGFRYSGTPERCSPPFPPPVPQKALTLVRARHGGFCRFSLFKIDQKYLLYLR